MSISEIQLYNILKQKLGEQEASSLVEFVKAEVKNEFETKSAVFSTKEDIANVKEDLANLKAELIKWMFIFWIGQLAAFIGIAQFILK